MNNNDLRLKLVNAVALGAAAAVVFTAGVVIAADLYLPLKNWLAAVFSHHWLGKGILALVVFAVFSVFFSFFGVSDVSRRLKLLGFLAFAGAVIISSFFVWEYVK